MKAIIILGPPGSGKGTQAKLIVDKLGYIHFDTGAYFEKILYDPKNQNNKEIQRERKLFEAGILLTPSWILKNIQKAVERITQAGWGIVFSGSPRTLYEATGDKNNIGLLKILEKNYSKKNIHIFKLNVPAEDSIKRNSARLICSVCNTPLMAQPQGKSPRKSALSPRLSALMCPFCGGKLRKRTLDKPEVIKERLKEYANRTQPVIDELKRRKYKITDIDGTPLPYQIHYKIISCLSRV